MLRLIIVLFFLFCSVVGRSCGRSCRPNCFNPHFNAKRPVGFPRRPPMRPSSAPDASSSAPDALGCALRRPRMRPSLHPLVGPGCALVAPPRRPRMRPRCTTSSALGCGLRCTPSSALGCVPRRPRSLIPPVGPSVGPPLLHCRHREEEGDGALARHRAEIPAPEGYVVGHVGLDVIPLSTPK